MTLWQIWWLALAIKTILLPIIPITPDEAYYFAWSRHLALSYFDHPPFISWIMTVAQPLWKTAVGIRWPGVILIHLGYIPWIFMLRRLGFSERAQIFWMISLLLGPLTGLGGFVITPDVPLTFFWSLGMLALLWIFDKPTVSRWLLLGVIVGLGMLSKYVMVLFVPCMLAWMFWDNKAHELKKPGIWLAGIVSIITFSPVLIWNYQNDFASFLFQAKHGLESTAIQWKMPVEYLSTQFAMINPLLFFVAYSSLRKRWDKQKLLFVFAIIPFAFFFMTSFRARVEANWPVCGYPSLLAFYAMVFDYTAERERWTKWVKMSLGIAGVFCILIITHTVHPWLPIRKDKDHTEITREWTPDIQAVKNLRPLYTRSYQMAAFHSYYRPAEDEAFKIKGIDRLDVYDFLPESLPSQKGYVILKADDKLPEIIEKNYTLQNPTLLPSNLVVFEIIPK
ncbi:MAG: glycosyltransferase family 39 protein [Oligoflexia bacterium]|nr:glycosyltransferase family 39 protein [Oligoflexia bacterium]